MRLASLAMTALLLAGCPNPQTDKIDPWLTAKTIINQSKIGVPIAESIFMQWTLL
jgi:hypothetical protein